MRIKIPFTKNKYVDFSQLLFGWVTMFLLLVIPFISVPFISVVTWVRDKIQGIFTKKTEVK